MPETNILNNLNLGAETDVLDLYYAVLNLNREVIDMESKWIQNIPPLSKLSSTAEKTINDSSFVVHASKL